MKISALWSLLFLLSGLTLAGTPAEAPNGDEVADAPAVAPENAPDGAEKLPAAESDVEVAEADGRIRVYRVRIDGPIEKSTEYVLRRVTKDAITEGIDAVVIDMNTPGGRGDVMIEAMDMFDRFEGEIFTYVNEEAISAGALMALASDEIYMSPRAIIGASEAIQATGEDLPETLKAKFYSYLRAKIEIVGSKKRYWEQVGNAMLDRTYELRIDGKLISASGDLLSLTAAGAIEEFGEPPVPLLSAGIYESLDDLLDARYGEDAYEVIEFESTWSEGLASWLGVIAPALLAIGFVGIFVEFKTPGFGLPGAIGVLCILVVFGSNYVAGLAGSEAALLFVAGVLLVLLELFLFPGFLFVAGTGVILMLGSLIWSMADIWPTGTGGVEIAPGSMAAALRDLLIGVVLAIVGMIAVWRFLPQGWVNSQLVLSTAIGPADPDQSIGGRGMSGESPGRPQVGDTGEAGTDLHPGGEVIIGDRRYQALTDLGSIERGEAIRVVGYRQFSLLVEKVKG